MAKLSPQLLFITLSLQAMSPKQHYSNVLVSRHSLFANLHCLQWYRVLQTAQVSVAFAI